MKQLTQWKQERPPPKIIEQNWNDVKKENRRGIITKFWIPIFVKLENLALKNLVPWDLLISLAAMTIEEVFHVVAFFAVIFQIVRFILSLTGQGGMAMHQLQSMSGLKLRTPSSMMNLLLMPNMVWC
jgi:hypothetical protein